MKRRKRKVWPDATKKETRKRKARQEVRERLLGRWKGSGLEVKTLSQMWIHERPWLFNPPAKAYARANV